MYGVGGIPHTQWNGVQETVGGYPNGNWEAMIGQLESIYNSMVNCLLYTSPSPRDATLSRMPSSA